MRELWRRLAALWRGRALDDEVAEELRFHREMRARDTGDAAAAQRAVGSKLAWRERARDAWGWRRLDEFRLDTRYAIRSLRRSPGFTATAVATLALGIGLNVAVFAVSSAVLFKGFRGVDANDQILYVGTQKDGHGCCVSYPDYQDWRAQLRSFEGLGAVADLQIALNDAAGSAEHYDATQVTANTFALLGVRPALGRDFVPADEAPGAAPVTILSFGFWQRRYGSDPDILGRTVRINGTPTTVVGVMPRGFTFPQNEDVWLPLSPTAELLQRNNRHLWFAFGRLARGATFESARAELATVGRRLAIAYPRTNDGWIPNPRTFAQFFVGMTAPTVYAALLGAVAFVLLIACANFANLLLARAIGRAREISVRMAIGAGRWRSARQHVFESWLLTAAGGAAGWWIARVAVRAYGLSATAPTQSWSTHLLDFTMDGRALVYCLVVSLAAGLLFGLAPVSSLLRLDLVAGLKDSGRAATEGRRGRRLSGLLISTQLALSVVLVVGAGVMIRSFLHLYTADLGVQPEHVLAGMITLPAESYRTPAARVAFFDRVEANLRSTPGVVAVALSTALPAAAVTRMPYETAEAPPVDAQSRPTVSTMAIGPAYFQTQGAALLSGRDFADEDEATAVPAAIVNEQFAARHWPNERPLGRRLRLFDGTTPGPWLTVVGVASNIVQDLTRQQRDPIVYVPFRQRPAAGAWVLARTRIPPAGLAPAFQRVVQAIDPDLPIWIGPYPETERLAGTGAYWNTRNEAALLALFAIVGLLLAAVGLYAVVAHAVSRRTHEIGIRIAIGASGREILALVLRQGMRPVAVGLAVGLAASLVVVRLLGGELVGVSPADPATYATTCLVLLLVAVLGCLAPARRAMRVDPVVALRHE